MYEKVHVVSDLGTKKASLLADLGDFCNENVLLMTFPEGTCSIRQDGIFLFSISFTTGLAFCFIFILHLLSLIFPACLPASNLLTYL
jgi:hypothetical protein